MDKFHNMDLIGIPLQIIAGEKNISMSNIEIKDRITGNHDIISLDKIEKYLECFVQIVLTIFLIMNSSCS